MNSKLCLVCFQRFYLLSIVLLLLLFNNNDVISWQNHNISTLRLLQVVHRHGNRTITTIYEKDPFKNLTKYWPEGLGELTKQGKYCMYKLGQFIRSEYQQYLGSDYSPLEVYARSSPKRRCLESLACLLSGAYPPNNEKWKWGNATHLGNYWQPIPILTVPTEHMDDDRLLRTEAICPKATQEMNFLESSQLVQNTIQNEKQFLDKLGQLVGTTISTLLDAKNVYDHLWTEYQMGYLWSHFNRWSPQYEEKIFEKLLPLTELLWITEWNGTVVQRARAGPLIQELVKNIKNSLNAKQKSKKIYLYSTHDSMIAVLMHSLQVFNNKIIPLSASLLFELHESPINRNYFVRLYYLNETHGQITPHLLYLPQCDYKGDCPSDMFFNFTQKLIPEDWDKECGLSEYDDKYLLLSINISIITINLILVIILILFLLLFCYSKKRRFSYQLLD